MIQWNGYFIRYGAFAITLLIVFLSLIWTVMHYFDPANTPEISAGYWIFMLAVVLVCNVYLLCACEISPDDSLMFYNTQLTEKSYPNKLASFRGHADSVSVQ